MLADEVAVPSLLSHSLLWLRAPANELSFAVRSRLRWRRGAARLPHESKPRVWPWLRGEAAAQRLVVELEQRYDLRALRERSTCLVYAENLALLERLDALAAGQQLPLCGAAALQAIDVGAGVFQYATGLHRWLRRLARPQPSAPGPAPEVVLRGIELDGYRLYRDGHCRADHADSHAALAGPGVRYEVADFCRLALPPQDVVTVFFPFLSTYPVLQWGAPVSQLRPRGLLARAVAALRPGGWLVVVNQTGAEWQRLAALLAGEPVTLLRRESFATPLVPYADRTSGRVGSVWRRDG